MQRKEDGQKQMRLVNCQMRFSSFKSKTKSVSKQTNKQAYDAEFHFLLSTRMRQVCGRVCLTSPSARLSPYSSPSIPPPSFLHTANNSNTGTGNTVRRYASASSYRPKPFLLGDANKFNYRLKDEVGMLLLSPMSTTIQPCKSSSSPLFIY